MGIDSLLGFIKPALRQVHISNYRGQRAAIDAMGWLYRGAYSCAWDLNNNVQTNDFLHFIQKMINLLLDNQVTPVLIFDGQRLKAKNKTELQRKKLKEQNLKKAEELVNEGNEVEANKYFQRCLKITKQMLHTTFDVLSKLNIEFIVAPYEADAQISHLCQIGFCDFGISEDSDLICFQCPTILFKLQLDGISQELKLRDLQNSKQLRQEMIEDKNSDVKQFLGFKHEQIVDVCILSGCDYLPSIKGIGIKKAVQLMKRQGSIYHIVNKLSQDITYRDRVPKEYNKVISTIRLIFLYQIVYDPILKAQIQLNYQSFSQFKNLQENKEDQIKNEELVYFNTQTIPQIIGELLEGDKAILFSQGELVIKTLEVREKQPIDFKKIFIRYKRNNNKYKQKQSQNSENNRSDIKDKNKPDTLTQDYQNLDQQPINNWSSNEKNIYQEKIFESQKIDINDEDELQYIMNACDELLNDFEIDVIAPKQIPQIQDIFKGHNNLYRNTQVNKKSYSFSLSQIKKDSISDHSDEDINQQTKEQKKRPIDSSNGKLNQVNLRDFFIVKQ